MTTRRFGKLKPDEAVAVVDAFLGDKSSAEFTEKLAGQHLSLTVQPDGKIVYRGKSGKVSVGGGLFPQITKILSNRHPAVSEPINYEFEVIKKKARSDYIDYPIEKDFAAVELTGAMNSSVAGSLNSSQNLVQFLTKDDIKKTPTIYVKDPETKKLLQTYRDLLSRGQKPTKEQTAEIEQLLMTLVDSGQVPSVVGGEKIEGLFGKTDTGTFKIPAKSYDDLQRDQAKFFGVGRRVPMKDIITRFEAAVDSPKSDRFVSDVLDYVQKMSTIKLPKGFRTFFSPTEISELSGLASAYQAGDKTAGTQLAQQFFKRVNTKGDWVSTGVEETKQMILLRQLIKEHLRTC